MNNLEIINDIFERTKVITKSIIPNKENPQIVPIMNYLLATTTYLKGRHEAHKFKRNWVELMERLKQGIDENVFREYYRTIHRNVEQALKEEADNNSELAHFYQDTFLRMYGEAKMKQNNFNKNFGDKRREHYEYIFRTKERFEEALHNGDPAAFCD